MYKIAKIKFISKIENFIDCPQKIDDLLWMLHINGQILDTWIIEKQNSFYIANVITTDNDSLDKKYFNCYILNEIKNFDIEIEIIGDDVMATDSCHCEKHSYYIFAIHPYQISSPIICGDCGKEISLIKIPYLYKEEEHYSVLNFQKTFQAVDRLWMESLSDRFTKRQFIDYNSQLNTVGLDIRDELENKLEKPVYYLLCNPIGGYFEFAKNKKNLSFCPKCNGALERINHSYADKVCPICRLAFLTQEKN